MRTSKSPHLDSPCHLQSVTITKWHGKGERRSRGKNLLFLRRISFPAVGIHYQRNFNIPWLVDPGEQRRDEGRADAVAADSDQLVFAHLPAFFHRSFEIVAERRVLRILSGYEMLEMHLRVLSRLVRSHLTLEGNPNFLLRELLHELQSGFRLREGGNRLESDYVDTFLDQRFHSRSVPVNDVFHSYSLHEASVIFGTVVQVGAVGPCSTHQ